MCFFGPKILIFGPKCQFFVWLSQFLSMGHITSIPGATTFPFGPPQKFRLQAMGHFLGLSPVFGRFGHSHFAILSVLNFGPLSTKLGGTVGAIKKITHNDNGPDLGRNYGETADFTFGCVYVTFCLFESVSDLLCDFPSYWRSDHQTAVSSWPPRLG